MQIKSVDFVNFKVLRHTSLPLARFSLLIGPNGSGKSTAIQGLRVIHGGAQGFDRLVSAGSDATAGGTKVSVTVHWGEPIEGAQSHRTWVLGAGGSSGHKPPPGKSWSKEENTAVASALQQIQRYTLSPQAIAAPVPLQPDMTLQPDGGHLAGVLDRLRDKEPEQFEELNNELARWFPAFNRILFDTPAGGQRAFALRMREGYSIPAADLSDGTLLALAILTLGYVRTQSQIICIEEANRGVHPRLLRDVRDALYRLSYPESSGSSREPVQVIATTHSPYFLDLFRERPEEVVLAHRQGTEAVFERLSDRSDLEEILRDIHLGEAWFSGVLGGVPTDE